MCSHNMYIHALSPSHSHTHTHTHSHNTHTCIYTPSHTQVSSSTTEAGSDDDIHYWVPRIRLLFAAEDPVIFSQRVASAHQARQTTESLLLYHLYVDCMPVHGVEGMNDQEMTRVTSRASVTQVDNNERYIHVHTHIHTQTYTLSLSHTYTHTHTHSLSHKHTHTNIHSLSHAHTHTNIHTLSLTHTHTLSLFLDSSSTVRHLRER